MSRTTVTILLALLSLAGFEAKAYKPAGNRIMTTWGENIDPSKVWQEYPRPIMERPDWENLNGLWQYAILEKDVPSPAEYQGDILVPFCAESALSGVGKEVGEINGLMTYDRKVVKIDKDCVREANRRVIANHSK